MTYQNTLNVKLSNSHLNKLKSGIRNSTEVTLNLSSNVICDSNYDETNFLPKLLLTDTQVSRLCKVFGSNSLAKMVQLGGFLPFSLSFLLNPEKIIEKIDENKDIIVSVYMELVRLKKE